jgi:hypothetical protein
VQRFGIVRPRIAAVAWLLAVAACNQVFGNNQVVHIDGQPDVLPGIDAAFGTMSLTWMDEPAANAAVTYDAIAGARVQVGSLTDLTDLQDRPIDGTGKFTVPYAILQLMPRYRLVYTPADGIPVEFQTTLQTAHFVVPQIGRLDRTPWPTDVAPATGHIDFVASGWPTSYAHLRFLGTGLWSNLELGPTSATFVNYSKFSTDSGLLGVPLNAKGDQVIVTESPNGNSGVSGYGSLTFDGFDSGGLAINEQYSAWKTTGTTKTLNFSSNQFMSYADRVVNLWGSNDMSSLNTVFGGVIATKDVAPFSDAPINIAEPNSATGEFEKVVFARLSQNTGQLSQVFLDPFTGAPGDPPAFPSVVYRWGSAYHVFTSQNVSVRAGVQEIFATEGGADVPTFDEGVGLASMIELAPTGGTARDIGKSGTDQIQVTRPAAGVATFELTFGVDTTNPMAIPTDCMATLYRVDNTALTAITRYLVTTLPTTTLPILVDAKHINNTDTYTFGISCYRGHMSAATGDWTAIAFPFAVSRMWTHSFIAP